MVNKHNCDYCGKMMDRHLFCSASCKVRFHRGDKVKTVIPKALNSPEAIKQAIEHPPIIRVIKDDNPEQPQFSDTKKEGYHLVSYLGKYVKD